MTTQSSDQQQAIRNIVREQYGAIAVNPGASCCQNGCGSASLSDAEALARAIGYDPQSLAIAPEGANMGLSCGNPLAIAALREGMTVLDLGSGGGFDVFQAGVKVGAGGRVIGVDMTPEMLGKARANTQAYRERTSLDNVEFRLGEIEHLPVADGSVDVVISNCVINLSPDKPQVWQEIYRVLKPGGSLAVSDIALTKSLPTRIQNMVAALVGCVAGAMLLEETRKTLENLGFHTIALKPKADYVRQMVALNETLYADIAAALPSGEHLEAYVTSLDIYAIKPATQQ